MTFVLGTRSLTNLWGVHADLVKVVKRAIEITPMDFAVVEGVRTLARQRYLVATGKSKTLKSRHLTGHAVDLAPVKNGTISWDWDDFWPVINAMDTASAELHIQHEAGGHWKNFPDGPHHQLTWAAYP